MALTACTGSKSGKALLTQATERWPSRARGADGMCPSQAHHDKNPDSWHEPNAQGISRAVDLTHDPGEGCDCSRISEELRVARDPRVHRCIFGTRQWTSYAYKGYAAYTWRPYTGTPHTGHMHLDLELLTDDSPWPGIMAVTRYQFLAAHTRGFGSQTPRDFEFESKLKALCVEYNKALFSWPASRDDAFEENGRVWP